METNNFFTSECLQHISLGIPYIKHKAYPIETEWDSIMKMMDAYIENDSPLSINNAKFKIQIQWIERHGKDFLDHFALEHIENMKSVFYKNYISLIAFLGFGPEADSSGIHKDSMDVLLMQKANNVGFALYNSENPEDKLVEFMLQPGDMVWIPRGTWHRIQPYGNRVTYSFGVEQNPNPTTYI